ncbi:MAG TPA: hypothetical protein VN203_18890 [Candidatus Acidoferrum sp.]|nr:hypothetical protein [Candidatus Acidoferrum sp.]
MDDREFIRTMLSSLSHRLRLVRALTAGVRFLVVGLALAVVPLLAKGLFPETGPWVALGLAVGAGLAGALYGLIAPLPAAHAARLADRRLNLKERLTSARESLLAPTTSTSSLTDMARAQLAETAARLRETCVLSAFPLRLPSESRWLAPVAALVLALFLLPPLPLNLPTTGGDSGDREAKTEEEQARQKPLEQKLSKTTAPDKLFPKTKEQEVQRGPLSAREQTGDLTAVFQDTKMSQQQPDFGSFIKQGDERLKLLARPESLPDLSRDYTQSPYQVIIRRMQERVRSGQMQGLSWDQIERMLSEMGQSGQGSNGSELPDDLMSELEREGGGSSDKMMDALSRALNRLRDRDQAGRGKGQNLREAPGQQRGEGQSGQEPGEGEQGQNEEGSPGGSKPGTAKSLQTRGDPTPRIEGEKVDSMLEGDLREGPMEAYNTNLSGPGTQNPSRLPYMDVFSQYHKMMEETLTKESIPFNYREQVKEYFRSLQNH